MNEYTYILAPYNAHNWGVLAVAVAQYPEIAQEGRVNLVYNKSQADILGPDGILLVPADAQQYIYLKADAAPDDPALLALLSNVQYYEIYSRDNQPFNQYWL